ncbi:MAG: hypothetical protein QF632_03575 [Candidatus Woesearchaeota archaeon]|jgi:hypothetical protein|nr:hypothetical protein [Candidatus Woesearchaeota archaeon]MDP7457444.1 hypothetical protein [Candidatus Woesearchaeota archaeon]
MKLRKVVKKIVALGTGATMLGATLMGAMAADLADYPAPFISDGKFSGVLIIGDDAKVEDVVGVSDIAVSLQFAATKKTDTTAGSAAGITGDVFKIEASGDDLNLIEGLSDVKDVLDSSSLQALASGTLTNDKGTYTYDQYLTLGNSSVVFDVSEESDVEEDPLLYLRVKSDSATGDASDGTEVFRYKLSFPTALKSDVDTSRDLDDLDNKKFVILGKEYSVLNTEFTTGSKLTIEMMGGAVLDTLEEGETKTYTISGNDYEVTATTITDTAPYKVKFVINGETTDALETTNTENLEDGTQLGIKEILPNEAGDVTADVVEFYLGAQKLKLVDSNSSADNTDGTLTIGTNDISDGVADLVWSNTSSEVTLSTIQIAWQSTDNYYVPVGGKLSEHVADDQDVVDLLNTLNIDFQFASMSTSDLDEIKLTPSGNKKMRLQYTNKAGLKLSQELWYYNNTDAAPIILSSDGTRLVGTCELGATTESDKCGDAFDLNITNVRRNDFFVVETNKYSHLMQIKKMSNSDNTITLKEIGGDSDPVSVDSAGKAEFYKDGYLYELTVDGSYVDANLTKIAGDTSDIGNDGSDGDKRADLWTQNGHKIRLLSNGTEILEAPSITRDDTSTDAAKNYVNVSFTVVSSKISASGVTTSSQIADTEDWTDKDPGTALESDSNMKHGMTKWGSFIEHDTSGDQDSVVINIPEKEAIANVYVTAGVTKLTEGTASGTDSVTIQKIEVGATKLAKEVSDVKAQNAILVGGPCANSKAREALGNPADCAAGFEAGKGKIQLIEHANGNVALLVAGYSAADTRKASQVLADYQDYADDLKGEQVEVTTATGTVSEVTAAAVVDDPVVDPEE